MLHKVPCAANLGFRHVSTLECLAFLESLLGGDTVQENRNDEYCFHRDLFGGLRADMLQVRCLQPDTSEVKASLNPTHLLKAW